VQAASALGCTAEQVTLEEVVDGYLINIVRGCGKTDVFSHDNGSWSSLRERARFEMSCTPDKIDITILSRSVYGVTGCGQKIVYKLVTYVGVVADTASQERGAPTTSDAPSGK
jgi:hypothetical protein